MSYRLSELADHVGGCVEGDPELEIDNVSSLESAGPHDLSFLTNRRYRRQAASSSAGALLIEQPLPGVEKSFLLVDEPYFALAQILELLFPPRSLPAGIHPTAIVGEDAVVDSSAALSAYVVIGAGARIEARVQIHPHCVIGEGCEIGAGSVLYPHVVLYPRTILGKSCIVHAGVVLGSDGFGYAQHRGRHVKLEHQGRVVVEDGVEIGSNSTVDRALLAETRIGAGTKIDNLVQVAHNVRLGKGCLLISQSGIAGSSRLGDGVVLAGQAGVSGHLELGDGVMVAAKSAVFKSVEAGRKVAGIPAGDIGAWKRQQILMTRLDELRKRLERLESAGAEDEKGEAD